MEDILKALEDAGVSADQAPLVVGALVFVVLLVVALVVSKAVKKTGAAPDPNNPWIVGDGQQPQPPATDGTASNAPRNAEPSSLLLPAKTGDSQVEDMLRAVMDGANLSPEERKKFGKVSFMTEMGTAQKWDTKNLSHKSSKFTFTFSENGGEKKTVTLDDGAIDKARQMLGEGTSVDDICRALIPEYNDFPMMEKQMINHAMTSFLGGKMPKFGA